MAWLKIETETPDKPEMWAMAEMLSIDVDAVFGKAFRVWCWFDQHTEDGNARGVTFSLFDRLVGLTGFASSMEKVGWLIKTADGITLPNFDRHNGQTAKNRANTAVRVAKHKAANAKGNAEVTPESLADALPREREELEENLSSTDVEEAPDGVGAHSDDQLPNCPHQKLIELYAQYLPELPYPTMWEGKKQQAMRARWRWVLTAKKRDGSQYATDEASAVAWFDRFFAYVAKSDFLTGRNEKWMNCDLGWLMKADNFSKVVSGNYENKGTK
jgi:hypothetical protein